jgi:hypothetical protein
VRKCAVDGGKWKRMTFAGQEGWLEVVTSAELKATCAKTRGSETFRISKSLEISAQVEQWESFKNLN